MPDSLQEFCTSRGIALRVDRDAGLLRGVKLLGLASKNGREYPQATLARAASLYEGAKVNVNHPKGHPLAPRDYQDRLGTIRNVAARPGEGLFGDLQYNPKHALAEQLLWDAEHAPENVGFSHNVQARTAKRPGAPGQTIVEEILAVQSVDLVADPATTRGLFESAVESEVGWAEPATDVAHAHSTAQVPGDVEQQQSDARVGLADSAHLTTEAAAEIERLRAQVNQLQAAQAIAHKRAAIAALLVEHGLPPLDAPSRFGRGPGKGQNDVTAVIISDNFVQLLLAAPDEAAMRTLVRERAALVEQARRWQPDAKRSASTPQSREQTLVESHGDDSLAAFVKAIRA